MKSNGRPVTSGVPQRLKLGPVQVNILINGPDDRTECTLSKCAEDTELYGGIRTSDGCAGRDLNKLEQSADGSQHRELQSSAPGGG